MENCLVTKLKEIVNNDNLPILVNPTLVFEGSKTATTGTAVGFQDIPGSSLQKDEVENIYFKVETSGEIINKYALLTNTGGAIIAGDSAKGYYIYEPNVLYKFNNSMIASISSSVNYGMVASAPNVIGSGNVKFSLWVEYKPENN